MNLRNKILDSDDQSVAIIFNEQNVTYGELKKMSKNLAVRMHKMGIKEGDVIVQCVNRGIPMIVGMVAIQLIGGVYCPIHPEEPVERIEWICHDVNCKLALTTSDINLPVKKIFIEALDASEPEGFENIEHNPDPLQPC